MNNQDIKDIEKICDQVIDEIKGDGMEIISKELLSAILNREVTEFKTQEDNYKPSVIGYKYKDWELRHYTEINIHELAHKCLVYGWENMYEITPRVMGAEIMCLKTGYQLHIVQREDVENPEMFDPRFVIKACQWIL